MSNTRDNWLKAEPLYDGHLEKPLHKMTVEERLRWIDEGARMIAWARQVRIESGLDPDPLGDHPAPSQPDRAA